jgi:oxygen-dependent protoporphyrinogen oxidase
MKDGGMGQMSPEPLRVAVVGGGISGLSAAYYLERQSATGDPVRCTLLEASERLGGKVQTESIDGFLLEQGPDSLLARKPHALRLCAELGLSDEVVGSNPAVRGTFVLHRGRLEPLPESMVLVAPTRLKPFLTTRLISPWGKLRAAADLVLPARQDDGDESLAAFVTRRFGREMADRIAIPLLASVFGGGNGDLSVLATFPELRQLERTHHSVLRGLRSLSRQRGSTRPSSPFVTLRGGLHTLIDRLEAALQATDVRYRAEVRHLSATIGSGRPPTYHVELTSGEPFDADAVILATPADVAGRLLRSIAPSAVAPLSSIHSLPALVVAVAFEREQVAHLLDGTGFLVPADEGRSLIACTWVSRKWPHASDPTKSLFRCYLGGATIAQLMAREDAELSALAVSELAGIIGISGKPLFSRVYRWENGVPHYTTGHLDRVREAEEALQPWPGLVLAGASYHGIGVPDCIRQGEDAARAVLQIRRPVAVGA